MNLSFKNLPYYLDLIFLL